MTPIPPGTALRLLLLAWSLDDPQVSAALFAWLTDRLFDPAAVLTPGEYAPLAPKFLAWGESLGITEMIDRAVQDAAVTTTTQKARLHHV